MKKNLLLVLLAISIIAGTQLLAQGHNTGAQKPAGYINQKVVPGVQNQNQHQKYDAGGSICLPCAIPEGEADIPDEGIDVTNGGCNQPSLLFTNIHMGDAFCGRGNGYDYGGFEWRDTDWYRVVLTTPGTIYWSCFADFNAYLFILGEDCISFTYYDYRSSPAGVPTTASATLPPGTYHLWVGPENYGHHPGNTGNYMVKLSDTPPGIPDTWCQSAGVPTLSQWGLIILAVSLLATASIHIIRRKY